MIATASPMAIRSIESKVDALLKAVEQFRWDYLPRDPTEGFEAFVDAEGYDLAHAQVVRLALAALLVFERHLGPVESFGKVSPESHQEAVQRAGVALDRFASGTFAHRGGFSFDADPPAMFSNELTDALFYLATNAPSGLSDKSLATRPPKMLRALELCAGAGGQAIGLMSAGFRHVALYEKNGKRVRTLKRNWPTWEVRRADVRKISDDEFRQYRSIDVLAGGPPCEPFSQAGCGSGHRPEKDLFPEMIRSVKQVGPRAFMFENVLGMQDDARATEARYRRRDLYMGKRLISWALIAEDHIPLITYEPVAGQVIDGPPIRQCQYIRGQKLQAMRRCERRVHSSAHRQCRWSSST